MTRRYQTSLSITAMAAGILISAAAVAGAPSRDSRESSTGVEQIIQGWPETSRKAADAMIRKYGQPHEYSKSQIIWHNNGPWVRTIVYGYEIDHDFPMPHKDVLEQFIRYRVPPDKFDDLAQYDGSVIAERTKGELSARCDKEGANFLALNLAHDVVRGAKSVEIARRDYANAIKSMMEGETPEIMRKLAFEPPQSDAPDPDQAMITK